LKTKFPFADLGEGYISATSLLGYSDPYLRALS